MRDLRAWTSILTFVAATALLAGCGGAHAARSLPVPSGELAAAYTGPLADATFRITIPGPKNDASASRRPSYVSSATQSVRFTLNTSSVLNGTQVSAYNARPQNVVTVGSAGTTTCPASTTFPGEYVCTVTIQLPPGSDNMTVSTYATTDGTGSILSQQVQTFSVQAGQANSLSITLDANAGSITVVGVPLCYSAGPVTSAYASVGTSPVNLSVVYKDAAGKTIVPPGAPVLTVRDSTTNQYASSGTITGTTGSVTFSTNSSAQSVTLTPTTSPVAGVNVQVRATPASSTDGLPQSGVTASFTFYTGPAPLASLLAAIEQAGAGRINFYTLGIGATSGSADSFNDHNVSGGSTSNSLAITASTTEPGNFDVDSPLGLAFDSRADLLVANAGTGTGGDNGNLACVPAGSIDTGYATATTNSTNVALGSPRDPVALLSDQGVVLANNLIGAAVQADGFALSGKYTQFSSRSVTASGMRAYSVVALPTPTSGSYAVALSDGTSTSVGTGHNKVTVSRGDGSGTYDITDSTVDLPRGLAWDAQNGQLAVASSTPANRDLDFFSITSSSATLQKTINTNLSNSLVATSTANDGNKGRVAVAGTSFSGASDQIQIYDNTPARGLLAIIPYNLLDPPYNVSGCSNTPTYGPTTVMAMTWLNNTKLLVALRSSTAGLQGLHIYDVSAPVAVSQHDDRTCAAEPASSALETGTKLFASPPAGFALKP